MKTFQGMKCKAIVLPQSCLNLLAIDNQSKQITDAIRPVTLSRR